MSARNPSLKFYVPLAVFLGLVVVFLMALGRDPADKKRIVSPLVGKPAPAFELPSLADPQRRVSTGDRLGQVWLLNVWATWCATCAQEHPFLNALSEATEVDIVGLNWKDDSAAAIQWLRRRGDPYAVTAVDQPGGVGIDYGVVAAPETFVIDKRGVIRHKHIGAIDNRVIRELLPLLDRLQRETG